MLWVCIHPYSVVKATSVAVNCGCAIMGYPYSVVKATSVAVHCGCAIVGYPYSVVKATSVAVHCGCAFTNTFFKASYSALLCAVKHGTMSVCNRVSV